MLLLAMVVVLGLTLAGCGGQKNELDTALALTKQGDCAGAAPYLDDTVAQPDGIWDLAYAFFLKGQCARKAGDAAGAYENFYAARVVTCYAVSVSTGHEDLNTYARSDYCERVIPEILSELAPDVGADRIKAIEAKVNSALDARYMERFATKKY
jgi:hypothetical protein